MAQWVRLLGMQTWNQKFNSQNLHKSRRESTLLTCPLTPHMWIPHIPTTTMKAYTYNNNKNSNNNNLTNPNSLLILTKKPKLLERRLPLQKIVRDNWIFTHKEWNEIPISDPAQKSNSEWIKMTLIEDMKLWNSEIKYFKLQTWTRTLNGIQVAQEIRLTVITQRTSWNVKISIWKRKRQSSEETTYGRQNLPASHLSGLLARLRRGQRTLNNPVNK